MPTHYFLKDLIPIGIDVDADGNIDSYYKLPTPILWVLQIPHPDDLSKHTNSEVIVTKIAVTLVPPSAEEKATAWVIPLNEDDEPDINGALAFEGVSSYEGVLAKLGFTPDLPNN
ncbi:hypothetical protein [Spirosoma endophyticum]|uniref:Uncharacterized protein n=1 Tax=Spirosoma endophyticum TaxID=662367 RepID=A0A1I1ZIV3_9BACT|nr:hypothetical protein [Spirosoma endophyticum]SFE31542.1 hypothetical protein SAMN05216167_112131 [Spirosoma endophyticum]